MTFLSHGSSAASLYALVTKKKINTFPKLKELILFFIFGMSPDIPLALLFISGQFNPEVHHHHQWITHTPIFWIVIFLVLKFFKFRYAKWLLISTLLHLSMDWYGAGDGIAFLYPFIKTQYGLALSGIHGKAWLVNYLGNPIFLSLEILVNITFLIVLIKSKNWLQSNFRKSRDNLFISM